MYSSVLCRTGCKSERPVQRPIRNQTKSKLIANKKEQCSSDLYVLRTYKSNEQRTRTFEEEKNTLLNQIILIQMHLQDQNESSMLLFVLKEREQFNLTGDESSWLKEILFVREIV